MLFETKHNGSNYYRALSLDDIFSVPHCHTSFELLFVTSGEITACVGPEVYTLCAGEGIMILPMQIHSYETADQSNVKISLFSSDYIPDFYSQIRQKVLVNPIIQFVKCDVDTLQKTHNRFEVKSLIYQYCAMVIQSGTKPDTNSNSELMIKIVLFVQNNYKDHISLRQLADELGYSYNYLSAYFKVHFSCGFSEYKNRFRLADAEQLLKNTDLPITQVAFNAGFTSIRNFNDTFKKEYHMSPCEYRSNH